MRARSGKESTESRGSTARNDGLHPFDGAGDGDGSVTKTQDVSAGFGSTGRKGTAVFGETAWFAPIESDECKDGVCPVPWAITTSSTPSIQKDVVNHPSHYTDGEIECIEAIEAQLTAEEYRGYLKGNIAKYVWREKYKGGTESLKKAQWYLTRLIELE